MIKQVNLQPYTTFRVPAMAAAFDVFQSVDALKEVLQEPATTAYLKQLLILGGGSNMLFTKPFEGLVLKNEIKGIELIREDDDFMYVKAGAGENWHQFVMHCISQQWAGVENLSLIPGCVGASPIQNIGAYGVEIKDVFHELEAMHLQEQSIETFTHNDCRFGYRESVFKNKYKDQFAILSVTFRLRKKAILQTGYGAIEAELEQMGIQHPDIAAVSKAVIQIRSSKLPDPAVIGNAGSFFKNPVITTGHYLQLLSAHPKMPGFNAGAEATKVPAAWLIEQCGWKGYRTNDAGVHERQPLVLVNYGTASGQEIYALSAAILESVQQKFGITLEREVNIY